MAIATKLSYANLDELNLDPMNPRLGRHNTSRDLSQDEVLDLMKDWTLDELAVSYLEEGVFWTHEALLVTKEKLYGTTCFVVIEGNRRLAALQYLRKAYLKPASQKWAEIAKSATAPPELFSKIPYVEVDSREEIEAFLGFRHVTGIKEWDPAEKAEFIAKQIDERGMDYATVMRKIGSKTPAVRRNYISYRLLLQMEAALENFSDYYVEDRFSVMYLSLRTKGVQKYLQIDIKADPKLAKIPVPESHLEALGRFALWLFGDENHPPLFTDSRQVDNFGRILENDEAVQYLERTENPKFDVAMRTAGEDETEIITLIQQAADNVELSLGRVHFYKDSDKLQHAVRRLVADANQLLQTFPSIRKKFVEEES